MPTQKTKLHSIDILPGSTTNEAFFTTVNTSICSAISCRAAIAFWTLGPDFVDRRLPSLFQHENGYLCVDIHKPTDIDQLVKLSSRGSRIYIHLKEVIGRTEIHNLDMPKNLLHSKFLIFDFENGESELLIGSHNWTQRAVLDLNLETSVKIKLHRDSKLYHEASRHIENIRSFCVPFNPADADYYRWLQGLEDRTHPFIELIAADADSLQGTEFFVFGSDPREVDLLKTIGKYVYVSAYMKSSGRELIYQVEISTSSRSRSDIDTLAGNINSLGQRFMYRHGNGIPILESHTRVSLYSFYDAEYCVKLQVIKKLAENSVSNEPVEAEKWKLSIDDPIIARRRSLLLASHSLDGDEYYFFSRDDYPKKLRTILNKAKIKIPAVPTEVFRRERAIPLKDKEASSEHRLVRRKTLRND